MKENEQIDGHPRFSPSTNYVQAVYYDATNANAVSGYTTVQNVSLQSAISLAASFVATSVALLHF